MISFVLLLEGCGPSGGGCSIVIIIFCHIDCAGPSRNVSKVLFLVYGCKVKFFRTQQIKDLLCCCCWFYLWLDPLPVVDVYDHNVLSTNKGPKFNCC